MQEKIKRAIEDEGYRVKDDHRCYTILCRILRREDPSCPNPECGESSQKAHLHRVAKKTIFAWQCPSCGSVYNAWTGTILQGVHRRPIEILLLFYSIVNGNYTIAQLSDSLGRDRKQLAKLVHTIEDFLRTNTWISKPDVLHMLKEEYDLKALFGSFLRNLGLEVPRDHLFSAGGGSQEQSEDEKRFGAREPMLFNLYKTIETDDEAEADWRNASPPITYDLPIVTESQNESTEACNDVGSHDDLAEQGKNIESHNEPKNVCCDRFKRCIVQFTETMQETPCGASFRVCLPGRKAGECPTAVSVLADRPLANDDNIRGFIPRIQSADREDPRKEQGLNPVDCYILSHSTLPMHSKAPGSLVSPDPYRFVGENAAAGLLLEFRFQYAAPPLSVSFRSPAAYKETSETATTDEMSIQTAYVAMLRRQMSGVLDEYFLELRKTQKMFTPAFEILGGPIHERHTVLYLILPQHDQITWRSVHRIFSMLFNCHENAVIMAEATRMDIKKKRQSSGS